jgi:ubiquitin carboxyl-terminal hydrolase 34
MVSYANMLAAGSIERAVLPELTVWLIGLPTDRPYWNSYYRNRYTFWEEFGVMVQRILYRRINLGVQFRDDDQSEGEIFTLFFEQYLRICAVMMQVDADMLSTIQQGTAPDVLSCRHIRHFAQMIRLEKPPLLVMLERDYRVDTNKMSLRLTQELVRADGIKSLFAFADAAHGDNAVLLKRETAVCLTQLIHGLGYLMRDAGTETGLLLDAYYHDVLQFFRRYSADLQNPSKVTDIGQTRDMVHSLANLLGDLCVWDSSLAAQLAEELLEFGDSESPTTPTLAQYPTWADRTNIYREDPAYYPILIPTAWKFKLLRKYLVKGRMELRVMSIGAMDNALVEIWRVHNGDPLGIRHPVMQYLADFLLHERVTDYIISVDSHPQIIQRSGNVVGFLVVTRRYSSTQTDAIWNTVSRSSDPRVVSATQTMLNGIFGLMCGPDLVYFVSKFYDLPIETYSMEMLRTFKDLTFQAQQKTSGWSNIERNARPWNVLVRLLQDTSPGKDTGKVVFDVHNGAYEQLCLIRRVISDDERHEICRNCATLIASRSPKSTGCVRIISVLTAMLHIPDKSFFKENPDVTRHILEETCAFVKDVDDVGSNQAYGLQFRLDLLSFLIHATDAIPQDLHQNIWDHLVGKHAQTNYMRDLAWSRFGDALRYNFENDFCQQLISSYVPSLEPQYYTLGLFNFVAAYRFPPTKRIVATPEGDKEVLQARGADLLWSLVLSAPPHTIEDQSTQLLAARYLELGTHVDMSVQDVEACHIALVEQCMDELLAAYKVMRNGSGVLEDDQMDIALSKPTRQQNERRFTRTILFLRTLLMSIRTRPEFNRGRRSDSKVEPLDLDIPQGDTLEIRYSVGMEKHSLLVGVAATLQDLYDRLCQATGYSKVSLFAYGQRIILAEKRHASIVDLRLPETVTTVQMAPGCVVSQPRVEPSKDCSVFETTLLNQFEKLFGCMDADDAIGLVVRRPSILWHCLWLI